MPCIFFIFRKATLLYFQILLVSFYIEVINKKDSTFMKQIVSAKKITKSIGDRLLFKGVDFAIYEREKISLIGPNGVGKSTLLKILAGILEQDSGEISYQKNVRIGYIPQVENFDDNDTLFEAGMKVLNLDAGDEIDKQTALSISLSKVGFEDFNVKVKNLSGGWKKRLSIASQMARHTDVLMLDEPTNHLDLDGIEWLEEFLKNTTTAFVVISHDRRFLEKSTNRTVEINHIFPEHIFSVNAAYEEFLEKRATFIEMQEQQAKNMANKARYEQEWLRRGVRARGTKQEARKKGAYDLFEELAGLKGRTRKEQKVDLAFEATERKTKRLLSLHNACKSLGDKKLIEGLDITLVPGMRIGLLGANGCGKSTLMNLISEDLDLDAGTRTIAHGVNVVKFDQSRKMLNPNLTLRDAITPAGGNEIEYRGKMIHVAGWAQKLRFRGDQLESPVRSLSGGEQARVLMGQLMLQPADILLLDEPTNDLDIPSLEILEESLNTFPGAVVLVTHDREMLDRICHVLLAFEGDGKITAYADYEQYKQAQNPVKEAVKSAEKEVLVKKEEPKKAHKLTYKEQKEWDDMEENIMHAEESLALLQENPCVSNDTAEMTKYYEDLGAAQEQVDTLYKRWSELESLVNSFK